MGRDVYRGRIIRVSLEEARMPNGQTAQLEIVHHGGAAAVVAMDDGPAVWLVRHFRWAAGGTLWELPAGILDRAGESAEACARRELVEETGLRATRWTTLGRIWPSPGYSTEAIELFLAEGLLGEARVGDAGEGIGELRRVAFGEALAMVGRGEIADAKTIAGLCLAAQRREARA